jgi:hypothetical protein
MFAALRSARVSASRAVALHRGCTLRLGASRPLSSPSSLSPPPPPSSAAAGIAAALSTALPDRLARLAALSRRGAALERGLREAARAKDGERALDLLEEAAERGARPGLRAFELAADALGGTNSPAHAARLRALCGSAGELLRGSGGGGGRGAVAPAKTLHGWPPLSHCSPPAGAPLQASTRRR